VPLRDAEGEIQGAVAVARDVTARRTAEERAQQLVENEKLRALGQMASGVAHDLNQSLGMVVGHSELALRAVDQGGAQAVDLRDSLNTVLRAALDGADSVKRLLTFARTAPEESSEAELATVLREVAQLTAPRWRDAAQAEGRPISLHVEVDGDTTISASPASLREALTNLVFNAVDAMPEGGKLTLRTYRIEGQTSEMDQQTFPQVCVEVSDTGLGMDEETRRRCLEPFFTTKGERGTGLGLAMVYGMVQRHSAELEIDSAMGKGSTFRLIFPAYAPAFTTTVHIPLPVLAQRLRILLIDDDPLLIKSLRDTLESDGHVITSASGGQAGIDAFSFALSKGDKTFDVVVTDLGMPYVDGRKVAAAIKSASARTPVIMLTGWGQRLIAENDIPPHVNRVLSKPPRLHELRAALAELTAAPA
jgi:signal transduction histidine kinase/ActR/RegA family two-component response regulator